MKKLLLTLLLLAFVAGTYAQNIRTVAMVPGETSVIKDSSGMVYPYVVWQRLLASGNYRLRSTNPKSENPEFAIIKLTDAELDARYTKMPRPPKSENFKEGEKIFPLSAKDLDGNKLKLKDLAGKVVVLNFWFIGCGPCRQEMPALNDLTVKYANDPDVVFIAVALDDARALKDFLKTNHFGYHVIGDGRFFTDVYKIHLFPTNVVLDKEGKVAFQSMGYATSTPYWIKKSIEEAKQKSI